MVVSKVLRGLEMSEPADHVALTLNTFQLKGLRQSFYLHATFTQRKNIHEYAYAKTKETADAPTVGLDRKSNW